MSVRPTVDRARPECMRIPPPGNCYSCPQGLQLVHTNVGMPPVCQDVQGMRDAAARSRGYASSEEWRAEQVRQMDRHHAKVRVIQAAVLAGLFGVGYWLGGR